MTKTLTKEEILGRPQNLPADNLPDYLRTMYDPKKVLVAMDVWAKQQSIPFAEWCQENGWEKHIGESTWFNRMGYVTEYATEQLYDLFLQDQNKEK